MTTEKNVEIKITASQLEECFANALHNIEVDCGGTLAEIIENARKYRWHDLRKDPNDLPETFVEVWICFTDYKCCGDEKFYDKAYRRDDDWDWQGDQGDFILLNKRYEIIAWREIEPFEEVDE